MKVGDLVRNPNPKIRKGTCGVILEVADRDEMTGTKYARPLYRIHWLDNYGTFWDNGERLEVISESR